MQIKETKWMRISSLFVTFSRGANKSNIRFIKNFKRGTSIIVTEIFWHARARARPISRALAFNSGGQSRKLFDRGAAVANLRTRVVCFDRHRQLLFSCCRSQTRNKMKDSERATVPSYNQVSSLKLKYYLLFSIALVI